MSKNVHVTEVGARDGFQFISEWIPTQVKLDTIKSMLSTGVPEVQVSSFVRSDLVPQMKDAAELFSRLDDDGIDSSRINALVLNMKGFENAVEAGVKSVEISISINNDHGRRNAGMSARESLAELTSIVSACKEDKIRVRTGLQCVFGYERPGDTSLDSIKEFVEEISLSHPDLLSLADTTGMANPNSIGSVIELCMGLEIGLPIALHLHDTRGLGLANVSTALGLGIRSFDSSIGGLGGCPFVDGAAGNIATEDLVYLLHSLGYSTGIDLESFAKLGVDLSKDLSLDLPSKIHQLSRLDKMNHVG